MNEQNEKRWAWRRQSSPTTAGVSLQVVVAKPAQQETRSAIEIAFRQEAESHRQHAAGLRDWIAKLDEDRAVWLEAATNSDAIADGLEAQADIAARIAAETGTKTNG